MDPGLIEILGNQIVVIGDVLALEASILEYKIKNGEIDEKFEEEACSLDINGSVLSLLGDFILAVAASQEADEEKGPISQGTRDNIIGSYLNVVGDFLGVKAFFEEQEEDSKEKSDNKKEI